MNLELLSFPQELSHYESLKDSSTFPVPQQSLENFSDIQTRDVQNEALGIIPKELLQHSEVIQNPTDLHLINTRLWINELSQKYNRQISIGSVPENEWKALFDKYNAFWFMGIYQPSEASRQHCKKWPQSVSYAKKDIEPDKDIVASPFAIPDYRPNPNIAKDWEEWDKVVDYLHSNNKKVFLDFVPNHVALDHPWAKNHPEYFIQGSNGQKQASPDFYYTVYDNHGQPHHIAHGKDPNYPEWADTLQLNYANPDLQQAMKEVLIGNSQKSGLINHCDGVRCDMAMLLNPDTFIRTWGDRYFGGHLTDKEINYLKNNEFWPRVIPEVKNKAKELGKDDFTFVAEAYWDLEKLGENFDILYGKSFYDDLLHLSHGDPKVSPDDVKRHIDFLIKGRKNGQRHYKLALFTENHDEDRSVSRFGKEASMAAAVITALIPDNVFLINQGQDEGRKIRPPMQLDQPLKDPVDSSVKEFYERLLKFKNSRLSQDGEWSVLQPNCLEDPYVISQKVSLLNRNMRAYICTNFSDHMVYAHLPEIGKQHTIKVSSLTSGERIRNIDQERTGGLFIKLEPWESQLIIDFMFHKN